MNYAVAAEGLTQQFIASGKRGATKLFQAWTVEGGHVLRGIATSGESREEFKAAN